MTPEEREDAILALLRENAQRLERLERIAAVPESADHKLEHQWVQLAIKREAQSIALRQAVIEKTITALVWMSLVALAAMFMSYLEAHGWKR